MANYNGLICSLAFTGAQGVTTLQGGASTMFTGCTNAVPAKFFNFGQFALTTTQGVSGTFSVKIFGGVGGATYLIAQRDAVSTVGSFPIPLVSYVGVSGAVQNQGIPRPYAVGFSSASGANPIGYTANVFFAGEYN
jgi:hypothetical protein